MDNNNEFNKQKNRYNSRRNSWRNLYKYYMLIQARHLLIQKLRN